MSNVENFIFSSIPIEISEFANHKEATFLISVLDEYNLNGVLIEKAEGEKYHKTIIGYPILAYLKYDKDGKPDDFGGHELRAKYNSETKEVEYYFATFPIGSVIESYIEKREVEGYEGEKDCILIKTKLWKSRFPEYFTVFDKLWKSGNLASSWEISSFKTKKTTKGKILKIFEFIGNTCLGKEVQGAVNGAGVLDVASNDDINYELSNAILKDFKTSIDEQSINDINNNDLEKEDKLMSNQATEEVKNVSSLTENDLHSKIRKAINATDNSKYFYLMRVYPYEYRAIAYEWEQTSEDNYIEFVYSVNSDETISITSQRDVKMTFIPTSDFTAQLSELEAKIATLETETATKTDALVKASEEVEKLKSELAELQPLKEKAEEDARIEAEKVLAEKQDNLKKLALKGGFISQEELETSEEIKNAIEKLEEVTIKTIIADRFVKSLEKTESTDATIETSEKDKDKDKDNKGNANLNMDDDSFNPLEVMASFLKK